MGRQCNGRLEIRFLLLPIKLQQVHIQPIAYNQKRRRHAQKAKKSLLSQINVLLYSVLIASGSSAPIMAELVSGRGLK